MANRRRNLSFLASIRKRLCCCGVCSFGLFLALSVPLAARINFDSQSHDEKLTFARLHPGQAFDGNRVLPQGATLVTASQLPPEEQRPLNNLNRTEFPQGLTTTGVPGIPQPENPKDNKEEKDEKKEEPTPFIIQHWDDINTGFIIGLIAGVLSFNPIIGLLVGVLAAAGRHFHFKDKKW